MSSLISTATFDTLPTLKAYSFTPELVTAIREGYKTKTRRPAGRFISGQLRLAVDGRWIDDTGRAYTPPFNPGDQLWLREEHYVWGHWEANGKTEAGAVKYKFVPVKLGELSDWVRYADNPPSKYRKGLRRDDTKTNRWYKRNSRFMLRAYARTIIEVTELGAEQVRAINHQDAIAEGVRPVYDEKPEKTQIGWSFWPGTTVVWEEPYQAFAELWFAIYGLDSWNRNDWVWKGAFKLIAK